MVGCALCGLTVGIMWPGTFSKAAVALQNGGTAMFADWKRKREEKKARDKAIAESRYWKTHPRLQVCLQAMRGSCTVAPVQMHEAAIVDGANKFQQIWNITIPGMLPTIVLQLILNVGQMMNISFDRPYVLGNTLVQDYCDVLSTFVYRTGITNAKFDRATAIGLFQSVVGLILISGANFITKKMGTFKKI